MSTQDPEAADRMTGTWPSSAGTGASGRRVKPGAHRGRRLTRRERKRAQALVEQSELEATLAWFAQVRALEDVHLDPAAVKQSADASAGIR